MQYFVTKQELNLLGLEQLDEAGVVIEVPAVCCGSGTPFVRIDQFQTSSKIAKETGLEQQAHTGSDQFLTHNAVQFHVLRTHKIFELVVFGICCGAFSCHRSFLVNVFIIL